MNLVVPQTSKEKKYKPHNPVAFNRIFLHSNKDAKPRQAPWLSGSHVGLPHSLWVLIPQKVGAGSWASPHPGAGPVNGSSIACLLLSHQIPALSSQ